MNTTNVNVTRQIMTLPSCVLTDAIHTIVHPKPVLYKSWASCRRLRIMNYADSLLTSQHLRELPPND